MNINSDKYILPEHYKNVLECPHYAGNGNLSIKELQALCSRFEEYCHQQAIIKATLIREIKTT
jgi:hypothetical protein